MNTNCIQTLARATRLCGLTIALALFGGAAGTVGAGEISTAKGGGSRLLDVTGRSVAPKSEASDYKPMSCAMCKNEFVQRVDRTARGAHKPLITLTRHLCDGCTDEQVVSGHGKAKTIATVHKCTSCGAESLACCSTSKSGAAATKGMEKPADVAPAPVK